MSLYWILPCLQVWAPYGWCCWACICTSCICNPRRARCFIIERIADTSLFIIPDVGIDKYYLTRTTDIEIKRTTDTSLFTIQAMINVVVIWFYTLIFLENQPPIEEMSLIFGYRNLKRWTNPTHAPTKQKKIAKKYDKKRKKLLWRCRVEMAD